MVAGFQPKMVFSPGDSWGKICGQEVRAHLPIPKVQAPQQREPISVMSKPVTALLAVAGALILVLGLIWFGAGGNHSTGTPPIDSDHKALAAVDPNGEFVQGIARHWLDAAATPEGFLVTEVNRAWQPQPVERTELGAHSRLVYVFAAAYDISRDAAFRNAVHKGADYMLEHFTDPVNVAWHASVGRDGKGTGRAGPTAVAQAILALVNAHRITGDGRYLEAARLAWTDNLEDLLVLPRMAALEDPELLTGIKAPPPSSSLLHAFEALLALHDATGDDEVWRDAEAIARFAFKQLAGNSGGFVAARYDASFQPLDLDDDGGIVIGHQFSWAYLVSRAMDRGLSPVFLDAVNNLMDATLRIAGGGKDGLAARASLDGKTLVAADGDAATQAAALRALAHFAAVRGRSGYWQNFSKLRDFVATAIVDPENEGWLPRRRESLKLTETEPAKSEGGALGFHAAALYAELARLQGLRQP